MKLTINLMAILTIFLLYSCGNEGGAEKQSTYSIVGKTTNIPSGTKAILEHIEGGSRPVPIDTATVEEDGSFEMTGSFNSEGIGRIKMGRTNVLTVLNNANYLVEVDGRDPRGTTVTGNSAAEQASDLISKLQAREATTDYLKNLADTSSNLFVSYLAVNNLRAGENLESYEKLYKRFQNELPDDAITKNFAEQIEKEKVKALANKATAIGAQAQEIKAPNTVGQEIALSSLRGKIVFIDFWASWCGPCRRENPTVVAAYKKYKNQGFEVYSVSLDNNKERWLKAIEKDNLIWDSHVSELKKWNSQAAAAYGVTSIPSTFLIDQEGKIIGKNLRGHQLENKLKEIFGA